MTSPQAMSVRELKEKLQHLGVSTSNFIERQDFVDALTEARREKEDQQNNPTGTKVNHTNYVNFCRPAGWGEGPVTKEDLKEFSDRRGERCPTPSDAIRYGELSTKIENALKDRDYSTYTKYLDQKKAFEKSNKGTWTRKHQRQLERLEERALSCSDSRKTKIKTKRDKKHAKSRIYGKRVRIKASGRKGTGGFAFRSERGAEAFYITLDCGGPQACETLDSITMLCVVCDNDATSHCGKCRSTWYCGTECQRVHWKKHKKTCKPLDGYMDSPGL